MPTYIYENRRTGAVVELFRTVAQRHNVPKDLKLILAPGHGGIDRKLVSEGDADRAVPRALKQLTNRQANQMIKESGFSLDHFRKTWDL